jgi:outer membrane lipoprotein-sorting protein
MLACPLTFRPSMRNLKTIFTRSVLVLAFSLMPVSVSANASNPKALAMLQKAADNFERLTSIRAQIQQVMSTRGGGQRFQGEYVGSTPGRLHMKFALPYEQRIVSDGKELWWHIPQSNKIWHADNMADILMGGGGAPGAMQSVGFENIDIAPNADVFYTLNEGILQRFSKSWKIDFVGNEAVPDLKGSIWLDRKSGLPVKVEMIDRHGKITLRQTFEDYFTSAGVSIPTSVLIEMPQTRNAIHVLYSNIQLNVEVDNNEFQFIPPEGVPVVPLTSAM